MGDMETERSRPSLAGARLRISRAFEHANQMVGLLDERTNASGTIWIRVVAEEFKTRRALDVEVDWSEWSAPPSGLLSLLASEALFNARDALDYLVYELAWLDSGTLQKGTQFPIIDDANDWPAEAARRLRGVNDEHRDAISEYQPFAGCEWTRSLRELSNADKHRLLVSAVPQLQYQFHLPSLPFGPDPDDPSKLRAPAESPMVNVVFPSNEPAIDTLHEIAVGAAKMIERFQVDFGEHFRLRFKEF